MRGFSPLQMYLLCAGCIIINVIHCSYMDQLKPPPHTSHITQEHTQTHIAQHGMIVLQIVLE